MPAEGVFPALEIKVHRLSSARQASGGKRDKQRSLILSIQRGVQHLVLLLVRRVRKGAL